MENYEDLTGGILCTPYDYFAKLYRDEGDRTQPGDRTNTTLTLGGQKNKPAEIYSIRLDERE
jgi:hypothetical protein